jgi:hypothetical protein
MSRETNLSQIEAERIAVEQEVLAERGPDEVLAAPNPGVIVVAGETSTKFPMGISGSLTTLADGTPYLLAGSNITLATSSNGSVTISAASSISVGGLDTEVQFNDGGSALGGDSNFTFNKTTGALTVTNISGSLTEVSAGVPFLSGTSGVTVNVNPNGGLTIHSTIPGHATWQSYVPAIRSAGTVDPTLPTGHVIQGKYVVQGQMMTLMFNFSGASNAGAAAGDSTYIISLPTGYAVDSSVVTTSTATPTTNSPLGSAALLMETAGTGGSWSVVSYGTSNLCLVGKDPASASAPQTWSNSLYPIGSTSNFRVSFVATIPLAVQ